MFKDIHYVGVDDHQIDLFEGQYNVLNGMSYNSYLMIDDNVTILIDTVDINFKDVWLNKVNLALNGRNIDYLIIEHMEPDHSANILNLLKIYPDLKIIGNAKTFQMLNQFFENINYNKIIVNDNDVLSLGNHNLHFIFAPMVHWPEVMVIYDDYNKVLFSADAFGKFGALDINEAWIPEARRYYFGIVGSYGVQVNNLLNKLNFDISAICPLHGPVLDKDLDKYIGLYKIWATYQNEDDDVLICCSSIYGHTLKACELLKTLLEENGKQVTLLDLARSDMHEAIALAFKHENLVLASVTYNGDMFYHMATFIKGITARKIQNKRISLIDNGTWAPMANKAMKASFDNSKNITFIEPFISIKSSMNSDTIKKLEELAKLI